MAICDQCEAPYEKARKSQRFCSTKCRQVYHNSRKPLAGPRGIVSMVRKLKNNSLSVTVNFVGDDAMRALYVKVGENVLIGTVAENGIFDAPPINGFSESQINLDFGNA